MDDFPIDEEDFDSLPLSPSLASTFNELYTVNPPSPILTPSQVAFTWSSGDIPVLLYDEAYAEGGLSVSGIVSTGHACTIGIGGKRDSSASATSTPVDLRAGIPLSLDGLGLDHASFRTSRVSGSARSSRVDSGLLGLGSLDSSNTITSVGTFGPKRKALIKSHEPGPEDSPLIPLPVNSSQPKPTPPANLMQEKRTRLVDEASVSGRRRSGCVFADSTLLVNDNRSSRVMEKNDTPRGSDSEHRRLQQRPQSVRLAVCGGQKLEFDVNEGVFLTPKKAIPTNISWISSRDWDSQQYKEFVARENLSRQLSVPYTPDIEEDDFVTPPRRSLPVHPRVLENRDMNVVVETPRASQFAHELHKYRKPQEKSIQDNHHSDLPLPIQQDEHAWLKDITIQFLVDQEGFRAAQPSFRFTGVARLRSAQSSRAPGTIMAQFRPITRQAFHFHHAPFETPPVLRRVTVDFDETHDYLSKQAHLTLKSNGVYVLHGHEMSCADHETEPTKLHWQFEYLVDDRRVEGSGRIMEGEKILTPLNFSCTPFLVLPKQGKRNSIMHVFKKGVASKLVAEKLQPPGAAPVTSKAGHPVCAVNCPEADANISHFFSSKTHAWSLHKRGQSHAVPNTADTNKASNLRSNQNQNHWATISHRPRGAEYTRRRRASSAGENHRPSDGPSVNTLLAAEHRDTPSVNRSKFTSPTRQPARHIIPPAKLAELFDTPTSPTELTVPSDTPQRSSTAFVPLTPRPRYTSHVRDPSRTR